MKGIKSEMSKKTGRHYQKPRAVDLFSGCGGMTLGLRQAGYTVIGAVEIDSLAVRTYEANHKGVEVRHEDIRNVNASEFKAELGLKTNDLDLLVACPPCQGYSSVRTRNGSLEVSDPRNDLIFEVTRFVRELRPKAVMLENVPALATDHRMEQFCSQLYEMGYQPTIMIVDAAKFGVPQRRRRMVLIAINGVSATFPEPSDETLTVRHAIGSLPTPKNSRDRLHRLKESHNHKVTEIIANIPHDGGSRSALREELQLECHKNSTGFKDVYGRMAWDKPAPTITGGCFNPSKGRFLHPDQNRAISMREAALLQGFPRRYRFCLDRGKIAAAEMIGNALPPELVRRHAAKILSSLTLLSNKSNPI